MRTSSLCTSHPSFTTVVTPDKFRHSAILRINLHDAFPALPLYGPWPRLYIKPNPLLPSPPRNLLMRRPSNYPPPTSTASHSAVTGSLVPGCSCCANGLIGCLDAIETCSVGSSGESVCAYDDGIDCSSCHGQGLSGCGSSCAQWLHLLSRPDLWVPLLGTVLSALRRFGWLLSFRICDTHHRCGFHGC